MMEIPVAVGQVMTNNEAINHSLIARAGVSSSKHGSQLSMVGKQVGGKTA